MNDVDKGSHLKPSSPPLPSSYVDSQAKATKGEGAEPEKQIPNGQSKVLTTGRTKTKTRSVDISKLKSQLEPKIEKPVVTMVF
jgi:hypothetical protein